MLMNEDGALKDFSVGDYPYRYFGARAQSNSTVFRVFAPAATEVLLLRPGNNWGKESEYLHRWPDGTWEIDVPENLLWSEYKYLIKNNSNYLASSYQMARIDPFSPQLAVRHENGGKIYNSIVTDSGNFKWTHKHLDRKREPLSIYELHLGTFHDGNYRQIAEKIVNHVGYLGFTHVQIMPPFQTPLHKSWGYLVGCPYAIYERHGSVDDFKYLVNHCHQAGIGVIVDIPLGFGVQDWDCGLAHYDGTDLYHHAGARGWNNQWQSRVYNHTSAYVRDYLIGICTYVHNELGVDGARIDAVAAQIFFDYDRGNWDWPRNNRDEITAQDWELFNSLGGDRHFDHYGYWLSEATDFDALRFFRELHNRLKKTAPDFFTIAEESRRVFTRLAVPVEEGGLGFTYAQNMGEMHRVRAYLKIPVEERKIEHVEIIIHNNSPERFINAMNTHDECANGKVRLITELGSHIPLIGLAALCWFRAGAPMIFQGDEFGEEGWFDVEHPLDWGKTGCCAQMHQQQITNNFHDLNRLLATEPALANTAIFSMVRNGSNNERKWFSFIRWAGPRRWDSDSFADHKDDIIFVRNESFQDVHAQAEIHVPAPGIYKVIYNSIDQRYIGEQCYNQHDPYWEIDGRSHILWIELKPLQNLALKLIREF